MEFDEMGERQAAFVVTRVRWKMTYFRYEEKLALHVKCEDPAFYIHFHVRPQGRLRSLPCLPRIILLQHPKVPRRWDRNLDPMLLRAVRF